MSPDGTRIAVVASRGEHSQVWVMNADGSVARRLEGQQGGDHIAWSPDGRWIAIDDGGTDLFHGVSKIVIWRLDGSAQRKPLTDSAGRPVQTSGRMTWQKAPVHASCKS